MAGGSCEGQRVAVVGSGVTGLSAAWLLHRSGAAVTLFEKQSTCGGHTLTDTTGPCPVDLGFQVYNLTTYPHLTAFLDALGVDSEPSDMSFALSVDDGRLEWGSSGLPAVFAQRRNLLSPSFLRMLWDVLRFGREAPQVIEASKAAQYARTSLGEYLRAQGYSRAFTFNYVVPMCAAVWSVPNAQVLDFPVQMLVQFWVNHHLLNVLERPVWRVVKGRSRSYVERVLQELPDVRTSTGVKSVRRNRGSGGEKVTVTTEDGASEEFDAVVLATHSDVTLAILGDGATEEERDVLSAIPYNENDVYLHTDASLMPANQGTWSSWNFLGSSADEASTKAVCVSYWLNRLQHLPAHLPQLFCTLNPLHPPAEDKVIRRMSLAHPVYSFEAVEAQRRVGGLQGTGGVYFAGAWCGYGFHEDGIKAGIAAATAMGASVPWTPRPCSPHLTLWEQLCIRTFDRFCKAAFTVGSLRFILPTGAELRYGDGSKLPVAAKDAWRGRPELTATVRVLNAAFFGKVLTRHDTGLGEAYMDGDFEVDSLGGLLALATVNIGRIEGNRGAMGLMNWVGDKLLYLAHRARGNTIEGSRRNIEEHYDAGNAMYELFLDDTMTYSCGIHRPGESLEQAQYAKLDAMIQRAGIKRGDRILEIGCGWGSMAMRAASTTGCHVTGLTLSKEQLHEATERVRQAGLQDLVTLLFCDYRDCPGAGTYDAVVSCEMIEAVGHEHLTTYFAQIGRMLKPGGRAVIQVIAEPDERYEAYCASSDFIREHIFPGGHLPSMGAMVEAARGTGLSVQDCHDIGPDYAITLRAWRAAWEAKQRSVLELGYSERFWRKYRFYFAYCEAAFDARYIHDFHITWVKDAAMVAPSPTVTSSPTSAASASPSSDPWTQVLLALYFFLAGIAVTQHPFLWVVPLSSGLFAAAAAAVAAVGSVLLPAYASWGERQKASWRSNVIHALFSALIGGGAAAYIAHDPTEVFKLPAVSQQPGHLNPHHPVLKTFDAPTLLTCCATGFYGYMLYAMVHDRAMLRRYKALLHYTVLLLLFSCAIYKDVHLPLLAATLVGELAQLLVLAARLRGRPPAGTVQRVAVPLFALLPHAGITALVATAPRAAFAPSHWAMAMGGLLYMNASNVLVTAKAFRATPSKLD